MFSRVAGGQDSDTEGSEEFGVQMKIEKTAALSDSLNRLKTGIDEAMVCSLSVSMVKKFKACFISLAPNMA